MQGEIQPTSAPGRRFVDLAETHAAAFDQDAAAHDQSAAFPHQHVEAVKQSGAIGAMVPAELGGLDVRSLHDLAAALTRFGRGDASITIGLSMHFLGTWNIARQWHAARATGKETTDAFLRDVAKGRAVMAILNAEPRSDNRHPFAEATPAEGGYRLNGRKSFGTLSPAATHLSVRFRIPAENGGYRTSSALIRADDPGVTNVGNWDAMGMRASGSHDVELKDVFVPRDATTAPATWGKLEQPGLASAAAAAMCLAAPFLGIAEAAHDTAIGMARVRGRQPGPSPVREWAPIQAVVAQNELDLASMRAVLARAAQMVDAMLEEHFPQAPPLEAVYPVMKEAQAAKLIVNEGAVRVVDRALTISGGSGYLAKSPLARYYRDVRAGLFMSPFGALEAQEYIARVALDLPPEG